MQIKAEEIVTDAGTMHDIVLTQGTQTIRLGLIVNDAQQALRELATWLEDNTMDLHDILADSPARHEGPEVPA